MPAFDVDVGVIYTHERALMPPLLSTMAASADGLRLRVILVDNASTDGTADWEAMAPHVSVVRNDRRLTYAANLNRILAASTARYVLLLNTDMYFDPEEQCIAKMAAFMDRHPRCGVSGCRLYHPDGAYAYPARVFPSAMTILGRRLPFLLPLAGRVRDYLFLDRPCEQTFACDWLSGCFLMARREAVLSAGPLDERFGKYFEDVDFCMRIALAGWQVTFHGGTYCYHIEQRASRKLFSRDHWLHLQSYGKWLWKWGVLPHAVSRGRRLDEAQALEHAAGAEPAQRAA